MADFINTAFIKQFSDNIMFAVQQKGSRFRGAVREETVRGEDAFFDTISAVAAAEITDNFTAGNMHPDTVITDTEWSRRKVTLARYQWADLIEHKDKIRMITDPTSHYVKAGSWAMARAMDDVIISAALGTAYAGKDGSTAVTLPSSQVVAHNDEGMTLAKLLAAKEILDGADVDPEEPRFIVMSAKQFTELLNTTEIKSSDYNTVKALVSGQIDTFLGFKFIRSERLGTETLTLSDTSTATGRKVFAWTKEGLLLAIGEEPLARVTERADKNYAIQVYFALSIGAVRMDENRVVKIETVES